ncbi:hypothetical protein EJB05_04446, partial [Eragrostis curvula]
MTIDMDSRYFYSSMFGWTAPTDTLDPATDSSIYRPDVLLRRGPAASCRASAAATSAVAPSVQLGRSAACLSRSSVCWKPFQGCAPGVGQVLAWVVAPVVVLHKPLEVAGLGEAAPLLGALVHDSAVVVHLFSC